MLYQVRRKPTDAFSIRCLMRLYGFHHGGKTSVLKTLEQGTPGDTHLRYGLASALPQLSTALSSLNMRLAAKQRKITDCPEGRRNACLIERDERQSKKANKCEKSVSQWPLYDVPTEI